MKRLLLLMGLGIISMSAFIVFASSDFDEKRLDNLVESSIHSRENLVTYINYITEHVMPSLVMIEMKIIDTQIAQQIDSINGAGIIIREDASTLYVLTSSNLHFEGENRRIRYEVRDFVGNTYTALIHSKSEELGLMLLEFTKPVTYKHKKVELSTFRSIEGEVILQIGYSQKVRYQMTLGLRSLLDEQSQNHELMIQTSIMSDINGLGSALLNSYGQLVGIAHEFLEDKEAFLYIDIDQIRHFLNQ